MGPSAFGISSNVEIDGPACQGQGVTISREISGEGLNVTIRGLGTNFTKILLNGAPVAVASTGRTDAQNTNREVDLDMCFNCKGLWIDSGELAHFEKQLRSPEQRHAVVSALLNIFKND